MSPAAFQTQSRGSRHQPVTSVLVITSCVLSWQTQGECEVTLFLWRSIAGAGACAGLSLNVGQGWGGLTCSDTILDPATKMLALCFS